MTKLQPGDPFDVEYGNGNRITVRALSLAGKRRLVSQMVKIQASAKEARNRGPEGVIALYDLFDEGLRMCSPDITDELLETFNEDSAFEVINQTIAGQSLSEDDRKKSESPQLSAVASCAANAPEVVAAS